MMSYQTELSIVNTMFHKTPATNTGDLFNLVSQYYFYWFIDNYIYEPSDEDPFDDDWMDCQLGMSDPMSDFVYGLYREDKERLRAQVVRQIESYINAVKVL